MSNHNMKTHRGRIHGTTAAVALLVVAFGVACAPVGTAGPTTTVVSQSTVPASECVPAANFPDLSGSAGAGIGYDKPSVQVSCTTTELLVRSNGMISYPFVKKTPNSLRAQNLNWHIPLQPVVAANPTSIVNRLGTLGFSVTGLPIYGPTEGPMPANEAFGDPVGNGILDSCKGHTGPQSEYHLHAVEKSSDCGFGPSPIVGYALDGFPIYGTRGCLDQECAQVVTFNSGYQLTGNSTTYSWAAHTYAESNDPTVLDRCNGRIGPDGTYRYYATAAFPYTFGCFKGTPTAQSGGAAAPMPPMG